jgi:hypothetical protein
MTMSEILVELIWHDAHAVTDSWTNVDDIGRDPVEVRSVGWLLTGAKPGHVVIAQSRIIDQDEVDNVLAVPKGMVRRVNSLHSSTLIPVESIKDE